MTDPNTQADKLKQELENAMDKKPQSKPSKTNALPNAVEIGPLGNQQNPQRLGYVGPSGSAPMAPSAQNPAEGGAVRNADGNYQRPLQDECQKNPCMAGCPDSGIRSKCPENFTANGTNHTSDGTIYNQSDWNIYFPWNLQVPEGDWTVQWRFLARQKLKNFRGKTIEYVKRKYAMRITDAYVAYVIAYWTERRDGNFIHNPDANGDFKLNGKGVTDVMKNRIQNARNKAIQEENNPSGSVRPPRTAGGSSGGRSQPQAGKHPNEIALDNLIANQMKKEVLGVYQDYGWKTFPETKDWIHTRRVKIPKFKSLPSPTAVHPPIWDNAREMLRLKQNDPRAFLETYKVETIEALDKMLYEFNRRAKAMNKEYPFVEWLNDALREMKTIDLMRQAGFPDKIDEKKHPQLLKYNLLWNWQKTKAHPYGYDLSQQYFNYDERSIAKFKRRIKEGALYYAEWQKLIEAFESKGMKIDPQKTQFENQNTLSAKPNTPSGLVARWFYNKDWGWYDDTSFIFRKKDANRTHKFKGRIKDIDKNPSWVWKEFGALIKQDVATIKKLFYNDPMAVLTKYVLDHFYFIERFYIGQQARNTKKTREQMLQERLNFPSFWFPPLLLSLIKKVIRLTWAGEPFTKLYFYPSQVLKTLAQRDRRTNQLDVRKVNFWRSHASWKDKKTDFVATGRDTRMPVPTPPSSGDTRQDVDKRLLIDEIKANIAMKKPIGSEKESLINRAKLMGIKFTSDPNDYNITQLQVAIQNYFRQGEGYKPSNARMDDKKLNWRDWATRPLSTIEQYGIVGLSSQGDPNNKQFLLNALVAKYSYLPVTLRPNPLLGKWYYEKSLSSKNVAVYRHRSRNEIKMGLRGTKDGIDFLTDAFVLTGQLDITKAIDGVLGYDSYVVRIKKVVDKVIKTFPRDKWEYSMAGHSLGGLACVFTDLWLQNDYMKANGTKREDRNGVDKYVLNKGVAPWKHIQIATFDAGAGIEQAVKSMIGFMNSFVNRYEPKSQKSSDIKLRQYRIAGDLISLAGSSSSAYSDVESYSLTFAPKCPEQKGLQLGGEGHSMGQFLHNNFLPEKDKIICRVTQTGLRGRGTGARRDNPARNDPNV